jgi:glycerol-3-phosphate dehydrogenase (NAD(P)+)
MENMPRKAAILGTGSWASAFGRHLCHKWERVVLWGIDGDQVRSINQTGTNPDYLGDIVLPPNLRATLDLGDALRGADILFVIVPSQVVRQVMAKVVASGALPPGIPVVNLAKGFEVSTLKRLSEVIEEELVALNPPSIHPVAVLLGPSHAEEVALELPTAVVLSGPTNGDWGHWQAWISGPFFRVYTNPDIAGVEFASAFKNIIALAVGMADGLGAGDNTRGTLMTRGMVELSRLGKALGGRPETFAGLAGIGDMITTCISHHSRNRNFGEAVTAGHGSPDELLAACVQVVEGVEMAKAALKLGEKHNVELPITKQVHDVLFSGKPPRQAMRELMERELRPETD